MQKFKNIKKMEKKNEFTALVQSSGLSMERTREISDGLSSFFELASEWAQKIETIVITDPSQKGEMKVARESRLTLRGYRLEAEKSIKEKREALKKKMADDILLDKLLMSANKMIKATYENLEGKLEEKEKFAERWEAERRQKLAESRYPLILRYVLPTENLDELKKFLEDANEESFNELLEMKRKEFEAEQKKLENQRRQARVLSAGFEWKESEKKFCFLTACITIDDIMSLSNEDFDKRIMEAKELIAQMNEQRNKELEEKRKENEELKKQLEAKTTPPPTPNNRITPDMSEAEKLSVWVKEMRIPASPVVNVLAMDIQTKFDGFKKWALNQILENGKK